MAISLVDPAALKEGQTKSTSNAKDPEKRLQETIDEIVELNFKGEKTNLKIIWEIGNRIHKISEDADMGDQVLQKASNALTEKTGGDDFSLATVSRYRAIYRMVPDKSQLEKLADSGVKKSHLYRLAQRDIGSEDQQLVLNQVLKGEINPRQIESEADSRSSKQEKQDPADPSLHGDIDMGDQEESSGDGDKEENQVSDDDAPSDPKVRSFIDLCKSMEDTASKSSKKFDKAERINDDFDGMDRKMQEQVEPYLEEALSSLSGLKKSTDKLMNRIKGCT